MSIPTRSRGHRLTPDDRAATQDTFLRYFRDTANVRVAAEKAGVSRRMVYAWRESDDAFKARFDEATEDANDMLRAEIRRRAVDGWLEPVYQRGVKVGTIRRYSDNLLQFLARARMPREFGAQVDITTGGQPLIRFDAILHDPDTAELAAQLAERATVVGDDASGLRTDRDAGL